MKLAGFLVRDFFHTLSSAITLLVVPCLFFPFIVVDMVRVWEHQPCLALGCCPPCLWPSVFSWPSWKGPGRRIHFP